MNIFSSKQEATEPIEGAHGLREDFLERMMAYPVKVSQADKNGKGTPERRIVVKCRTAQCERITSV